MKISFSEGGKELVELCLTRSDPKKNIKAYVYGFLRSRILLWLINSKCQLYRPFLLVNPHDACLDSHKYIKYCTSIRILLFKKKKKHTYLIGWYFELWCALQQYEIEGKIYSIECNHRRRFIDVNSVLFWAVSARTCQIWQNSERNGHFKNFGPNFGSFRPESGRSSRNGRNCPVPTGTN